MRQRRLLRQVVTLLFVCCSLYLFINQSNSVRLIPPPTPVSDLNNPTVKPILAAPQEVGDQILGDDSVRFVVLNASQAIDAKRELMPVSGFLCMRTKRISSFQTQERLK